MQHVILVKKKHGPTQEEKRLRLREKGKTTSSNNRDKEFGGDDADGWKRCKRA